MSAKWYYRRGTQQSGPMSLEELRQRLIQDGNLAEAFVWREGFDAWKSAPEVEELYPSKPEPPPLPGVTRATAVPPVEVPARQSEVPTKQKESGWGKAVVWIAALGGWAIGYGLSKVLDAPVWLPALTVIGTWAILSKCKLPNWAVPVLAIVIGHTASVTGSQWISIAIGKSTDSALQPLIDIVIVGGLTFWVLKTRSAASCYGLLVYEIICLTIHGVSLVGQPSSMVGAVIMHMIFRIGGIAASIYAIVKRRESQG
jgi:hypothetical protein